MTSSIYLPTDEDCRLLINIGDVQIETDVIELEDVLTAANEKAQEMGTQWHEELPQLFENKFGVRPNKVQAILINISHQKEFNELKKRLFAESNPYIVPVPHSPQQTEGKQTGSSKRTPTSKQNKKSKSRSKRK
jgi:hypothetical protein